MSRVVAVLAPLAILTLAWETIRTWQRNRGWDLDELELEQVDGARVLILGNSLSRTDIDRPTLASALEISPEAIAVLPIPGSVAPHWLALLAGILKEGHRPELVLIVGDLQSALYTSPRTPIARADLKMLLQDQPDLKARLVAGTGWAALDDVLVNRVRVRQRILNRLRAVGVGPARAERAVSWVFHDRELAHPNTREIRTGRELEADVLPPEHLPLPEDGVLPDLFALAAGHGIRAVLVRPPLSPKIVPEGRDPVLPGTEERVATLGELVDGSRLLLGLHAYADLAHLNPEGARRFTAALAARLTREGPLRAPGLEGAVTFVTPPPALAPRSGEPSIAGTVRWVVPQVGAVHEHLWAAGVDVPADCLPVEVRGAGELQPCGALFASMRTGWCFDGGGVYARGSEPVLTVDEDRTCGPYLWLYPGDTVRLASTGQVALGATGDAAPDLELASAEISWSEPLGPGTLWFEAEAEEGVDIRVRNNSPEHLTILWAARAR